MATKKRSRVKPRKSFHTTYAGYVPVPREQRHKFWVEVSEAELRQGWASKDRDTFYTFSGEVLEENGVLFAHVNGEYDNP